MIHHFWIELGNFEFELSKCRAKEAQKNRRPKCHIPQFKHQTNEPQEDTKLNTKEMRHQASTEHNLNNIENP